MTSPNQIQSELLERTVKYLTRNHFHYEQVFLVDKNFNQKSLKMTQEKWRAYILKKHKTHKSFIVFINHLKTLLTSEQKQEKKELNGILSHIQPINIHANVFYEQESNTSLLNTTINPPSVLCLSHTTDNFFLEKLNLFLYPLIKSQRINFSDRNTILAGSSQGQKYRQMIESADIILFMISAEFLAISKSNEPKLSEAIKLIEKNYMNKPNKRLIPIKVKPCLCENEFYMQKELGALPKKNQGKEYIIDYDPHYDKVFTNIVKEIRNIIDDYLNNR